MLTADNIEFDIFNSGVAFRRGISIAVNDKAVRGIDKSVLADI